MYTAVSCEQLCYVTCKAMKAQANLTAIEWRSGSHHHNYRVATWYAAKCEGLVTGSTVCNTLLTLHTACSKHTWKSRAIFLLCGKCGCRDGQAKAVMSTPGLSM